MIRTPGARHRALVREPSTEQRSVEARRTGQGREATSGAIARRERRFPARLFALSATCALGAAAACGSLDSSKASGAAMNPTEQDSFGGGSSAGSGGNFSGGPIFSGSDAAARLPPEQETSASFELPHAGQRFVFAANPDSNNVAVIDGTTLAIHTVEAGAKPKFLQTLGGTDAAIVLNVDSSDATILRTSSDGSSVTSTVDVQRGSNAIAVAPDGAHAVVYYDDTFSSSDSVPGSFQDITVVTLAPGKDRSVGMTVGFRPMQVFFSSDGRKGFVVTEDGVSVLDFATIEKDGAGIATTIPLGNTGVDQTLDVSVTADGRYALARKEGTSELRLLDLETRHIARLDVAQIVAGATGPVPDGGAPSGPGDAGAPAVDGGSDATAPPPVPPSPPPPLTGTVTDVDLAPGGDYAMAVVRELSAAVKLPIPGAFTDPSSATVTRIPGELVGSVTLSPNGKYALLYTTADDTNERLTILGLSPSRAPQSYQLRKSIAAIAIAPDDATALVVHKKLPGDPNEPGIDKEIKIDRQDGYSVVQLDTGFPKLQVTQAPLGPFAAIPDGSQLFILFSAGTLHEVQKVDLRSFFIQSIELGSPPVSVGPVPSSKKVFVGQDHPDGRISFVDWTTGAVESVTGFELNSRIQQ